MYYWGGGSYSTQGPPLIACGGRGGREHPPLTHIQSNACRFLFLLFSYLRFAEAASFDKKELCRSDTLADCNNCFLRLEDYLLSGWDICNFAEWDIFIWLLGDKRLTDWDIFDFISRVKIYEFYCIEVYRLAV